MNKRGAPLGNKNALGNHGGASLRNRNAWKHGAYSVLTFHGMDRSFNAVLKQARERRIQLERENKKARRVRVERLYKIAQGKTTQKPP